jgi:cold shock CspA family protein
MGKSQETFSKKEKEKKRIKKRQDKLVKKEERKSTSEGGSLESMMAYVDEFGNLSDTPPDPLKKKKIIASNIEIGIPKREDEPQVTGRQGKITYFNDSKGYGFIKDLMTQENVFVHINGLIDPVKENDNVTFEVERGMKGMNAVRVKKA